MIVDQRDALVSRMISNYGVWEGGMAYLMKKIVKEGDHVLNLGSQSGMEALMMAQKVGPTGKVFIFEPYSFSYKMMRKSVILNGFNKWTTTYNIGASNKFGIGKIQVNFGNTGGS